MRNTYDGSHAFGYHLNDETRHVRGRINYGYSFGLRKQSSSEPMLTAADPIMPKAATNATCPTSIGYRSSCFDGSASGYGCICFVQRNVRIVGLHHHTVSCCAFFRNYLYPCLSLILDDSCYCKKLLRSRWNETVVSSNESQTTIRA